MRTGVRWRDAQGMSSQRVPFRTAMVAVIIGSFSIAALGGIAVLLTGGSLSETEGRVLWTTFVVGVASVAILCNLSTAGTRFVPVGVLGGLASVAALVSALVLVWAPYDAGDSWWKPCSISSILAATLAQACLLLVLTRDSASRVRTLLVPTLLAAAWVAGQCCVLIIDEDLGSDLSWRVLGIMAIVDVLGTVVVAALSRSSLAQPASASALVVPSQLAAELTAYAAEAGCSREEALRRAVAGLRSRAAG